MRTWAISIKVIKELFRDKRTLMLMFVAPLLILWLMSIMFSANSATKVKLATVGVDVGVVKKLDKFNGITVKKYASKTGAQRALKDNKVDGMIIQGDSRKYNVTYANTDATKTALTKAALKNILVQENISKMTQMVVQQQLIIAQLKAQLTGRAVPQNTSQSNQSQKEIKIQNYYNYGDSDTGFFDKIAPILMSFFTFFFVFLISGMALLKERTSGTLDRLLATPVKRSDIVFGYMLGYGVLALLQSTLISTVGIWILHLDVVGNLFDVMVISVLFGFVALAFGLLMSTFASSEFQMMQLLPLVIVPQVFFSGIIPLDSMATWVQVIGKILPLTYAGNAVSGIIMQGYNLADVSGDIMALLIFLIVLLIANILGLKRYRKV
ncbi:ABC transporter permease [Ligilactobacillus equi]|uniref:ABC superfamily ATP binding cassette transporter permease protein n=1 Tax=Ligilactobacillus equi DPC 6820 TaxID=1392007 RepID=V7HV76_9LACO|nr:ABC transporter permease [Ligilactobacillus equi]ETA74129.1 ABC superfamily ATP binding cassette transporter permease protein [Ligilactobacillus equi DPC 6820]